MRGLTLWAVGLCACLGVFAACGGGGGGGDGAPTPGSLDASFGAGGFTVGGPAGVLFAVAPLPDGRIVAVGETDDTLDPPRVLVMVFDANGNPDPSFSGDGAEIYSFAGDASATDVAVQANGMVVVGGSVNGGMLVMRISPVDGSFDPLFNGGAHRRITFPGTTTSLCIDVDVDGSGRIVLAGSADTDVAMARLHATGAFDNGFSGDGRVVHDVGSSERALAVAQQSDGSYVLAGVQGPPQRAIALRVGSTGLPDLSFGTAGLAVATGTEPLFRDIEVLAGDVLALAGWRDGQMLAVRLTASGDYDGGFGSGGLSQLGTAADDEAHGLCIQGSGHWVLAGVSGRSSGSPSVAVARLDATGAADPTFGQGGLQVLAPGGASAVVLDCALQADGKILAVGGADDGGVPRPLIVRLH